MRDRLPRRRACSACPTSRAKTTLTTSLTAEPKRWPAIATVSDACFNERLILSLFIPEYISSANQSFSLTIILTCRSGLILVTDKLLGVCLSCLILSSSLFVSCSRNSRGSAFKSSRTTSIYL